MFLYWSESVMEDRRQHYRLAAALPVEIANGHGSAAHLIGMSSNVSAGGARFVCCSGDFRPGQKIGLKVAIPPSCGRSSSSIAMETWAKVLRVNPTRSAGRLNRYDVACQFENPPEFN